MAYVELAEHPVRPEERSQDWREARSWYQKALDVWGEQGKLATLDALGRNQPAAIRQQLAKCDAHVQLPRAALNPQKQ
jgi:hypothetical protein